METVDEHVRRRLGEWAADPDRAGVPRPIETPTAATVRPDTELLWSYFRAQVLSRHTDLAARWLQSRGEGFYTISSAGHESDAAVALALRPTDPALLHYRSGGFYAARAGQVPGSDPVQDVLRGVASSVDDPISGGRHKVFGHHDLAVIPQTSTIGSHLPRAVGLAFALGKSAPSRAAHWPADAVVVTSFGDASLNHSTTSGAINAAAYCTHRGIELPLLLVCEDNGIGISTRTPNGWVEAVLRSIPGIDYLTAAGDDAVETLRVSRQAADAVRGRRRPVVLHLRTVRYLGHAGSDAEIGYRSPADILRDYARDPLLAAAAALIEAGAADAQGLLERYDKLGHEVHEVARDLCGTPRLATAAEVMRPLLHREPPAERAAAAAVSTDRATAVGPKLPENRGPLTLAETINATLADVLAAHPGATVFGEDVGPKGGVYGVTRGLRKRFGAARVFDTLLDEQTILGTALGAALAGELPIPEIQYLAYLHNAEDQLRGEAASLAFFSDGRYTNGMVVRVAGLAYQRGFGGHFHNDNSVAVLRDIPGLYVAVPSHPAEAAGLLRSCIGLAAGSGKVCVFLEPIALYHTRDLFDGDGGWLADYRPPGADDPADVVGRARSHGQGSDLLIVSYGNGVRMSLRAAEKLRADGSSVTVLDLRWLSPLPTTDLVDAARRHRRVLVVDEGRRSGGVAEGVLATLVDHHLNVGMVRVTAQDSFIPLGPGANAVLVSEDDIVSAAHTLT
ncbi:transketolase C-terminal domain-containing protein [Nakamurella lactea]|uniref:transketolase C-terminal domain-containing protein n=1 Tax=Nakamurella lactea TaxID=459515 RepID=UPI0003FB8EDE|nr:transketolase C-terminal domain-containing protein [Nakamurella lactea]